MLFEALEAARDLGRLHEIASILIRFGFGDMVRRLGMGKALESAGRILHWKEAQELAALKPPERIRRALEELGPSFVKLGQILATRIDLFPPEYLAEFEKLHDHAPPVSFADIRAQVEEDIGQPLEEVFAEVDAEPLAAASIAQVHRATLKTGEDVVLKVRRPGIRPKVEADLRLLLRLADIAETEIEEMAQFRPKEIASQFARSLRQELDLANECRNAERVAANFADDPFITIPTIYWQWTAERLNVQQLVDGVPGTDLDAVDAAGLDRKLLAARGANAVLKMILEDRFFHADPHPGNVFYLPGNAIVFIDFGMTGYLSEPRARQLTDLLGGIIEHNTDHVLDVLMAWSPDSDTDETVLATELDAFTDRVHGLPLKALDLPNLIFDLVALLREHKLSLPPDLSLLTKAFVTLEGMGRQLDPDFDIGAAAMPYVQRLLLARFTLAAIAARGRRSATDLVDLLADLPADLKKLIRSAQKGSLRMRVGVDRLDQVVGRMDRAVSRLTMGIVIAALILGSSTVMTASGVEVPFGVPFFAMLGFFAAIIGGAWLVYSIWANRQ